MKDKVENKICPIMAMKPYGDRDMMYQECIKERCALWKTVVFPSMTKSGKTITISECGLINRDKGE